MVPDPFADFVRRAGLMPRPSVAELGERRAPALHRTLPTWARSRKPGGLEWRMYVPHRFGGALVTAAVFADSVPREEVARTLRQYRAALWGRDKLEDAAPVAAQPPAPAPLEASSATPAQSPPAPAVAAGEFGQLSLF